MVMNRARMNVLSSRVQAMSFKMNRRGELSLSFSFILAIVIIAAVIGVGFYMINYFLGLRNCTELGLYTRDLQVKIDDAWNSEETRESYTGAVPRSVEKVCIGNLSSVANSAAYADIYDKVARFDEPGVNLFYYPSPGGRCKIVSGSLRHARFNGFDCVDVVRGKATVRLSKGAFDSMVLVTP